MQTHTTGALERLAPLIGEWAVTTSIPGSEGLVGRAVFAWELDRRYVVQHVEIPHPAAPDLLAIVAPAQDGETFAQHYFDSRGVVRIYAMTLAGGVWTLTRTAPDFSELSVPQRFVGTFADDGASILGAWSSSRDGGATWEHDFDLTYTKVA